MTAVLRTLGGVPITITATRREAEALRCSEFHHVTPDLGGRYYFTGGRYAPNRTWTGQDPVRRYAQDCLAQDLAEQIARYHTSRDQREPQ